MIVSSKKRTRLCTRMFMDVLHNRPCNRDAIVSGSPPTQLVKQHQTARRKVVQDICCLIHFYHKGRLSHRYIIAGTHTGEYLIHHTDTGTLCRNKTPDLRQQRNQCRLAKQSRFTCHIRSRDNDNLLTVGIQIHIIGNVLLSHRKLFLYYRMASLLNIQHITVLYYRTDVLIRSGNIGKSKQTVQTGYLIGIYLNGRDIFGKGKNQIIIKLGFECHNLIFRTQNLFFVFLQLLCDITLCIHQRLFANPLGRHFVLMCITHLYIITEYIVIGNLQAGDAGLVTLTLLQLQQIILPRESNAAQLVQLFTDSIGYHTSLVHQQRRIILYLFSYFLAYIKTEIELFTNTPQTVIIGIQASIPDRLDGLQRHLQLNHLTRRDTSHGSLGHDAFQITDEMHFLFYELFKIRFAEEILHHIQTFIDRLLILQWKHHPAFQQTCSHRTDGFVDNIQQARTTIIHTAQQFQTSDSEFIQAHIAVFLNTRKRSDMADLIMLRHVQILQNGTRSDDAVLKMLHTKAFQILRFKMFQQLLAGRSLGKHPVFQLKRKELIAEVTFEHSPLSTFKQNFFGSKVIQQLIHIVKRSFRR